MSYLNEIPPESAAGDVQRMYERQASRLGYVPNYAKAFCHRPDVMALWADLLSGIRRDIAPERFELVTLAAARALRNSYCSLAHGQALTRFYPADAVRKSLDGGDSSLSPADQALVRFAGKVATDAPGVTAEDVAQLKGVGFSDVEIFDVVAVVAARAFFTRILDGLGVLPDAAYGDLEPELRDFLTVGRPIEGAPAGQPVTAPA
jgi:uncharacterized peroxidase-related enzyme